LPRNLGIAASVLLKSVNLSFVLMYAGFPRSIESIEKVLNFKIGFQDLEKVLNLAKIYIRY